MVAAWMRLEYAMLANSKLSQSRTILTSAIEKYLKDAKIKQDKLLKQLNAAYKRDNTKKKGMEKKLKTIKSMKTKFLSYIRRLMQGAWGGPAQNLKSHSREKMKALRKKNQVSGLIFVTFS